MREDRPSATASLVAFCRAAAHRGCTAVRGFQDPIAAALLPRELALLDRLLGVSGPLGRAAGRWLARRTHAVTDVIALRCLAIDEALRAALGRGLDQVVILGAGLDGRAYRMPELARASVFEVDHPASQAYKRARLRHGMRPLAAHLVHVPVDFERDRLSAALARAGHDPARPTFWIWEGVTMYLPPPTTAATLDEVARLSAPGSELAVTYVDPVTHGASRLVAPALRALVRTQGEPFRGHLLPDEMEAMLRAAGFAHVAHSSASDWARAHGRYPRPDAVRPWERMALATR